MTAPVTLRHPPERRNDLVLEYLLLGDLRELLEEPSTPPTRRSILVVLNVVLDELSLIEDDGFSDVLDDRPQWQREVEGLRGDKVVHYLELAELRECLEEGLPIRRSARQVSHMLRVWMDALSGLRRRENRLVQMAVNGDLGGEC
jgi:hypothetical protein